MHRSNKYGDIYTMLPRFVNEADDSPAKPRFLPVIKRSFERNGVKFNFEISPAGILIENIGTCHFYPGAFEELMESALRRLAVKTNPNFMRSENLVIFSLTEMISQLKDLGQEDSYNREQIDHSLKILCRASYDLSHDEQHMCFRAIERRSEREADGEKYYLVQFSSLFLNGTEIFEFCFGSES